MADDASAVTSVVPAPAVAEAAVAEAAPAPPAGAEAPLVPATAVGLSPQKSAGDERAAAPAAAAVLASDPYSLTSLVWFRPADLSVYGYRNAARAGVANRVIKALIASGLSINVVQYACLEDLPAHLALWRRMDMRRAALGTLNATEKGRLPPLMSCGLMVIELPAPANPTAPVVVPAVLETLNYPAMSSDVPLPAKIVWAPASPGAFKTDEEMAALVARINSLIAFWNGNA